MTIAEVTGMRLGQFQVEAPLGRGGMGSVYRGRDTALDRPVAIKVLPPELAGDAEYVSRFVREARTAAKLNHPNVVQVYGAGTEQGLVYMALELVPGGTLSELAKRVRPFPPRRACEVVRDAARGLRAAQALGIVHRDLKPDNVLLTPDGQVKLADFGLAVSLGERRITRSGTYLGTPHYSSPEQCASEETSPASDLYSLGVILFELLAGRLPYEAPTPLALFNKILSDPVPSLSDLRDDLPKSLVAVVARLLQKEPSDRYQDAGELVRDLERVIESLPPDEADGAGALDSSPGSAIAATVITAEAPKRVADDPEAAALLAALSGGQGGGSAPPPVRSMVGRLGALAGVSLALLAGLLVWGSGLGSARPPLGTVAVLDWELRNSEARQLSWLEDAVPDFVSGQLQGIAQVDRSAVQGLAARGLDRVAIRDQLGATWYVAGKVYVVDDKVGISTELRSRSGRVVPLPPMLFAENEVLERVADLGVAVRRALLEQGDPAPAGQTFEPGRVLAAGPEPVAAELEPRLADEAGAVAPQEPAPPSERDARHQAADAPQRKEEPAVPGPVAAAAPTQEEEASGPAPGRGRDQAANWAEDEVAGVTAGEPLPRDAGSTKPETARRLVKGGEADFLAEDPAGDSLLAKIQGCEPGAQNDVGRLLMAAVKDGRPEVSRAALELVERLEGDPGLAPVLAHFRGRLEGKLPAAE